MVHRTGVLISCLLLASNAVLAAGDPAASGQRVPRGLYSTFSLNDIVMSAQTLVGSSSPAEQPKPNSDTSTPPGPEDAAIIQYLTTLLDNPAISGLAPQIGWKLLNPNNPGPDAASPLPGSYNWNPLDDVFIAVDRWNAANPGLPPKNIQIINSAGFNSPPWVFSQIDDNVCGVKVKQAGCTGSCDGLFMTPPPILPVSNKCGYTTLFFKTEGGPIEQEPLPMPWNAVYKKEWQAFLVALNAQIQKEPSKSAFVSISMAGPTASSAEMILPNQSNQGPEEKGGVLALKTGPMGVVPKGEKPVGITLPTAWNKLFENFYGSGMTNTDQPFIEEWDNVIDVYGKTFSDVTLLLVTTTDALPNFPGGAPSLLSPAEGFNEDCDDPTTSTNAMPCAAVTWVLAYFTNPTIGGKNAKGVFEAGMTAVRDGIDLGTNGVKWLAFNTATGKKAPLPGTKYDMSRILGGVQFAHSFSTSGDIQAQGCPTYPKITITCAHLTPSKSLDYVLSLSYFPGTEAAPVWGASESVVHGDFQYYDAPMNFLEIYNADVIYASGLAGCKFEEIAGNPAKKTPPDVSTCAVKPSDASFHDVQTTQEELELTNLLLLDIAEPPALP